MATKRQVKRKRMKKNASGSCLCGKVKFHYELPTKWSAHCHCTICRRAHGAGYVTWVGVESEQFHFDEDSTLQWFSSSDHGQRGFCNQCGSSLFFQSPRWPGEMGIVLANIEDEIDLEPQAHAHYDTHVHWMEVPEKP